MVLITFLYNGGKQQVLCKQTMEGISSKQGWQQTSRFGEIGKNWTIVSIVVESNKPSVKTTRAVVCQANRSTLCYIRMFLKTLSRLQECDRGQLHDWIPHGRASDQDSRTESRTFHCYPRLWASVREVKSVILSTSVLNKRNKLHVIWCYSYVAGVCLR